MKAQTPGQVEFLEVVKALGRARAASANTRIALDLERARRKATDVALGRERADVESARQERDNLSLDLERVRSDLSLTVKEVLRLKGEALRFKATIEDMDAVCAQLASVAGELRRVESGAITLKTPSEGAAFARRVLGLARGITEEEMPEEPAKGAAS